MPNGNDVLQGAPVCAFCWYLKDRKCTIRDVPIDHQVDTFCLNHPAFMPDGNDTPIGPALWHLIHLYLRRWAPLPENVWALSPDTEEVRIQLLHILENLDSLNSRARPGTAEAISSVVIWQLTQFQEQRALPILQRLLERWPESRLFQQALREINNEGGD